LEWNPVLHSIGSIIESLEGTVVDKSGAPVPGVTVTLSGDSQPGKIKPVTTDATGRFRFDKLATGQAFVRARHKTETTSRETYARTNAPKTGLKLILPDADGRMSGIVLDHRGQPAVGAVIDAYSRGTKTTADAQGRFTLSGMEKGWFTADINHLSAEGRRVEKRYRLKTGMKDIRVTLPAQSEARNNGPVPVSLLGKPAPEIHVASWLNSPPLATQAGGGKVRILDFWGMECGPCLAGFPKVQAFWQLHQKDGIEIIATGDDHYPEAEVREFLQRHPDYTFPVAIRPADATDGSDYGVQGIPFYVVIGQDGTVLSTGHDWAAAAATALKAAKP
ncbi:MAG: carboxypeptidase regulatory-like domain-containing protein, partial [Prosthecobacter sp.]|nr:carboxypeptidase regulatory-like domain-containing protein [Prosthecobacter sp.]